MNGHPGIEKTRLKLLLLSSLLMDYAGLVRTGDTSRMTLEQVVTVLQLYTLGCLCRVAQWLITGSWVAHPRQLGPVVSSVRPSSGHCE